MEQPDSTASQSFGSFARETAKELVVGNVDEIEHFCAILAALEAAYEMGKRDAPRSTWTPPAGGNIR